MRRILLFFFCVFPYSVYAQQFLNTTSDHSLDRGEFSLAIGCEYFRDRMGFDFLAPSNVLINGPSVNAKLGLAKRAEFELNWDVFRFTRIPNRHFLNDVSDASFFTKFQLFPENILPSLGVRIGAKLPNASDETRAGTDSADIFARMILGKRFGTLCLFANAGIEIIGKTRGGQYDTMGYGIAFSYSLMENLVFSSELSGRFDLRGWPESPVNESTIRGGLSFMALNNWQLDIGASRGLNVQSESLGIRGGVTKLFRVF